MKAELMKLSEKDPKAIDKLSAQLDDFRVALARKDPNEFVQYVLRDEETQAPIKQAPYHEALQKACSESKYAVIWGHVELGKCNTLETLLWTPTGVPITVGQAKERWERGEEVKVLSINSKTRLQEWVKVKSVQYDSHAPCARITTRTGLETKVSFNHPFFIERGGEYGWCAAGELQKGDVVLTVGQVGPGDGQTEKPLSSSLAFDLGVLFGLACRNVRVPKLFAETQELSINVSVEVSRTNENVPDYLRILREMAERFDWRIIYHDSFNDLSLNRTTHVVVEGLRDWFERLGIHFTRFWNGRQWIQEFYSDNGGFFPAFIYQADTAAVRSFLAGFLLNRFKFEEPSQTTREIGIFLPITAHAVLALSRRAGVRITRSWGNFRAKVRVNKKHTTIAEENQYTRLHARRVDIYPLMKEAHDRIRNRYTHLAHTLEGYYLGYVDPDALGLEGDRRAFVEHRPPEPVVRDVVTGVQPIGVQPVYAVTIDSEDHTHVTDHILTHNTQQISIGRVLWEIGNNPGIRVCIIQATEGLAEDVVTTIKNYIEHSPEYHRVFPHIRRGDEWTSKSFTIERPASIKDPTVIAAGIHGNVLGRRFDLVIVDDGVTGDNADTDYMRKDVYDWLVSTPMSRLTRQARFWVVGNAWHIEDAMHLFAKMSGFNVYKFPARDQVTGEPLWPERWSRQRILDFASARPPWEVARALDCKPRSSETGRFRYAWFERALERGKGLFGTDTMCWGLASIPKGAQTFTGVDLGFSEAAGTDVTAIVTLMATPEGRITLLNIDQGNWDGLEIVERIARAHQRFKSYVYVESIIAQRWIIQNLRAKYPNIPVFPFQTRGTGTMRNKRHVFFGVEAIATELAQDLWDIPKASTGAIDPNIQRFIDGCMAYNPEDHTEDTVMACWIALQGARKQTGIAGAFGSAEHSLYAFVEDDLSPEERKEQRVLARQMETQKATEDWWGDIARELELPKRTPEQLAEDLGL